MIDQFLDFFKPRFGKINHMYMHLTVYYQFFPIYKLEKREGVVHGPVHMQF